MKILKLIIFLLTVSVSFSQVDNYETGKIINGIDVNGAQGESFALYLPNSYNTQVLSAIVFIFDPQGLGVNGLNPFISSAEKFNYILVCSNNTKNGPYERNFKITNRLFAHVFSKFNIDEKQIYTAGFSGGSRLACTIAVLTSAIQGVIGCGAGFSNEMDKSPSSASKFSYVGLVGDEDMNYQEMLKSRDWLNKFNIDNELFTYDDGHSWPPKEQIERAFMWLEIQAYKRELRKPNTKHLQDFYKENLAIADSLSKNQIYKAVIEYERLIRNDPSNNNSELVSEKLSVLKKSKKYKYEIKAREKIALKEQKISSAFLTQFYKETSYAESRDDFAWWRKELRQFEEKYLNGDDYLLKKMGKRVQFKIFAAAYEGSMSQRIGKQFDKAIYCDKLLVQIRPEEPWTYYRLAETYAMNNDAKNTRINLQEAVNKGFKDFSKIKSNPLFINFEKDKKFANFLMKLQ